MTLPAPLPIRPEALRSGVEKVTRRVYAAGYDQGRYGRRFPSGRVEWEPVPPRMRETPEYVETWWVGYRTGKATREEFDAQVEVASGPEADGPVGAQGVCPPRHDPQERAGSVRGADGRRGDAGEVGGGVRCRAPGRDEARAGVPDRVGVTA